MKKLLIGSVLAISSVLTVTGCTSVNATTDTTPATTTNMQKQHKAGMKDSMRKGGIHKGGMKGTMAQLDLTATQQAQIKAIMQEKYSGNKKDRSKYQAERAQMQQQMQTLTNAKTLDTAAVNRLADQQAAKTKQRFIERVQTEHAIAQVLTPEQRQKMAQLKLERKAKGHHGSKNRQMHSKHQQ